MFNLAKNPFFSSFLHVSQVSVSVKCCVESFSRLPFSLRQSSAAGQLSAPKDLSVPCITSDLHASTGMN